MARAEGGGLQSTRTQIALVVLATAALGVLYWQFIYSPLQDDEKKHQTNFRKLEKENKALSEEERVQNDMLKCKPELDALNRENELMLPAEAEPVAFLRNLSIMAASAGLEQGPTKMMAEAEVQAPPPSAEEKQRADERKKAGAGGKRPSEGLASLLGAGEPAVPCWEKVPGLQADDTAKVSFVRVPFVIEVRGTFHQLMRYFHMLHQHAHAGRIITVEDFSLTDPQPSTDGISMTAKFIAVGFREPDGAAVPEMPEPAAPRGGRAQVREATQRREGQVEAAATSDGSATAPAAGGPGAGQAPPRAAAASSAQAAPPQTPEPGDRAQRGVERITRPEAQ